MGPGDGEDFGVTRLRQRPVFDEVVEAHGELGKTFPSFCCCNPATQPRFMRLTAKWYVRGGIFPNVVAEQRKKGWKPAPRVDLDDFPAESNTQG